jgi:hypothetical protein
MKNVFLTRVYTKFQEFAAIIGGLLKIMTFIGTIITSTFTNYEMREKMFNSLFDFRNKIKKESFSLKSHIPLKQTVPYSPHLKNILSNENFYSEGNESARIEVLKQNKIFMRVIKNKFNSNKKEKSEIKLGICPLLKMFICCCNKDQKNTWKLVKIASEKLMKFLDYLKIGSKLIDFDRAKKVIFNKHQRKTLTISSRPNIIEEMKKINI